ncbi:MAG: PLP-dependent aminotransferase family protein [Pseudomonadota bacterium]
MSNWLPDLTRSDKPRYIAIADLIAEDIRLGRLSVGDRLPPQRKLASQLGVDFTTIARGYVEAQKRGLVESRVGQGTFVRTKTPVGKDAIPPRVRPADLSMNLPPELEDPALIRRMQDAFTDISRDMIGLLRYQGFGGSPADKDAAAMWLGRRALAPPKERLFVTPGAHPALFGILSILAKPDDIILSEEITYPGARFIAAQLRLKHIGLPMDAEGIDPDAFADACIKLKPKALYLNPTLQNPTTLTVPETRRTEIASVAYRHNVPIIEDDACGFIPLHSPPPFAAIAPDLTWHVAGLAKCLGAGLRTAYVVAPSAHASWAFAAALRAVNVMASPLCAALATQWIENGTADAVLQFIRNEALARQQIARDILPGGRFKSDPLSFNIWLTLPPAWTRSAFVSHMRSSGIGVVASDAFTVSGIPQEALRICLCGPISRASLAEALGYIAHSLTVTPEGASAF